MSNSPVGPTGSQIRLHVRLEMEVLRDSSVMTYSGNRMQFSETVDLPEMGFLEVAKVFGQFHDLALALQQQHAPPEDRGRRQ